MVEINVINNDQNGNYPAQQFFIRQKINLVELRINDMDISFKEYIKQVFHNIIFKINLDQGQEALYLQYIINFVGTVT